MLLTGELKSDLFDKIKRDFLQVVSILLQRCTSSTLTWRKSYMETSQEYFKINPRNKTPENGSCTATYLPSVKAFK